jgi:hypothetical protein
MNQAVIITRYLRLVIWPTSLVLLRMVTSRWRSCRCGRPPRC